MTEKSTSISGVMIQWPCTHMPLLHLQVIHHIVLVFRVVVARTTVPVHPPAILSKELHWIKKKSLHSSVMSIKVKKNKNESWEKGLSQK